MVKKIKSITINTLAGMVQRGFIDANSRMEKGFKETEKGFKEVNARLDRIENIILKQHDQRITRIERALAIK